MWLAGHSCAGKTFIGDYLATRGYIHIDGDQGNQAKDEETKKLWAGLYTAILAIQKGEEVKEEYWKPYLEFLVQKYQEAMATGKNVVLTFALLGPLNECDWLREQLPGIRFMVVKVDMEEILQRSIVRNKKMIEAGGMKMEDVWKMEVMKEARQKYGEEYSEEVYVNMTRGSVSEMVCCPFEPPCDWITFIPNNDLKDFEGIKAINSAVGLEWEDVDPAAVERVNMDRMKNLNITE